MKMRRSMTLPAALVVAAVSMVLGAARADVTATREIEDRVRVNGGEPLVVIVDNVFGSVRVTAHDRDSVDMTATETIRGDLQADIDRARAQVELRTESEPGRVAFRVRDVDENGSRRERWNRWDDFNVEYDIQIRVPRGAAVDLATVNDGDIVVDGVRGEFEVSNVNGAVRLTGLRGGGRASTVNGNIEATFERTPEVATLYKTINGRIEVTFPQDLAADLEFKTMHGEIYTDFEAEPVVRQATAERARDGGRMLRMDQSAAVRVGGGGPAHAFQTMNGDIYVRKAAR
jgi:hypothetical protein